MQALLLLLSEGLLAVEAHWAVETLLLQVKAHANPPSYRLCCRDSGYLLTGSKSSSASLFVLVFESVWYVLSGFVIQYSDVVFEDVIQVTVKCDTHFVVFDGISKDVRCSALLSMLEVRLGVKIPGNAQLIGNGSFIGIGESIEEVIQILAGSNF